jgi:hypothetical protein
VQIAHLLRRAGFGYDEQTLDEYDSLGVAHAVERLLDYASVADDVDERVKLLGGDLRKLPDLQRWWLLRMAFTKRPLQEKMTLFWHGLLTSATAKVGLPNPPHYLLDQNQFFRAHAVDHFPDVVLGIARHRLTSPTALVDYFGGLLLDGQLSADTRRALLTYLTDAKADGTAAMAVLPVNQRAGSFSPDFVDRKVRGLSYLLVASPEYQLA